MKGDTTDTGSLKTEVTSGKELEAHDGQSEEEVPIKVEEFLLVEDVAYVKMEDPCILAFWQQHEDTTDKTKIHSEEQCVDTRTHEWEMEWEEYSDCKRGTMLHDYLHHTIKGRDTSPCYTWQITKWLVSEKSVDTKQTDVSSASGISMQDGWSSDEETKCQRNITGPVTVVGRETSDAQCHHCSTSFSGNNDLLRHINEAHLEEDIGYFQCSTCLASFDSKNNIINHLQNVNNICRICSEYYCNALDLQVHYQEHEETNKYNCCFCNDSFADDLQYRQHVLSHEETNEQDAAICPNRPYRKRKKSGRKSHYVTKPYECVLCPKTYSHKHSLEIHMRKHTLEKTHKCSLCQATFYTRHSFFDHMKLTHSAKKPLSFERFDIDPSFATHRKKNLNLDLPR